MLEVAANGLLELLGRAMSAATDVALRERCEPTLDLVEPGCRGRSEVDVEPRVACEPGSDRRGLVRPVVVHHEVDVQLGRDAKQATENVKSATTKEPASTAHSAKASAHKSKAKHHGTKSKAAAKEAVK